MPKSGMIELDAVLAVAREGGFTAAATRLGVSPSAVSHAVAGLESRLGVRLFNRTTRSVALTEAGREFLGLVAPAVADIRHAMAIATHHGEVPTGTLRINATPLGGRQVLAPYVLEYLRRYPDTQVELIVEGRPIDIVAQGYDAGVRLAETVPPDMIAIPVGPELQHIVVGSPAYLAETFVPMAPAELARHRCIKTRRASGVIYRWEFEHRGEQLDIAVPGALTLNDPDLVLIAALEGAGLAYVPSSAVSGHIAEGRLTQVLSDWTPTYPGLRLYYPGSRHLPAGLRRFIDLITQTRRQQGSSEGAIGREPRPKT